MSEKDGGPAWPTFVAASPSGDSYPGRDGMSLRDWFAGQALAGSLANEDALAGALTRARTNNILFVDALAAGVYEIADAMLKARTQGES